MTPKWAWIAAWSGLGLAVALARAAAGKPLVFPLKTLAYALAAWIVWHWVAILWARSPGLALDRVTRLTWLTVVALLGIQWLRTRRALNITAWIWIGICAITAIWVLWQDAVRAWFPDLVRIRPNLPDWRGFLAGGLGNTNHLGDLLALGLLLALAMFGEARSRRAKWLLGVTSILLPAALIVCYSVGSNLGLIFGAIVMLVLVFRRHGLRWFARKPKRWIALAAAWALLILFFNIDIALNPHRPGILKQGFGSERWHEGGPTRLVIWAQSWEMIRQHPLLGVGTGNFTYVYPELRAPLVQRRPELLRYQGQWTNAAHNEILQTWAELGLVGLIFLVLVIYLAYRALLKDLREADPFGFLIRVTLAGLLTCWIAQAQMNFALQHPVGAFVFFLILMAILIEQRTRERGPAMPPLVNEMGPLELQVEWASMNEPTGLGAALALTERWAKVVGVIILACGLWRMVESARPVLAQREYRRAMLALQEGDGEAANDHFVEALGLDARAVDVRSRYSDVLINAWQQPAMGLEQLATVRKRLNSSELFLREEKALRELGRNKEAARARQVYQQRTVGK